MGIGNDQGCGVVSVATACNCCQDPTVATLCVGGSHTEVVGDLNPAVLHLQQGGTPTCGELGIPEFLGRRLQTSMTRATVEASTAGLGQTVRTKRPLVGGLSFHDVSKMWTSPLAHRLPGGIQAQSV